MSQKHHYYLVAAELVFLEEESENPCGMRINAAIHGDSRLITSRILAKAQQAVQMNFHKRMENPALKVVDVVILNITYLGEMTEEAFLAPPEGTKQEQVMSA